MNVDEIRPGMVAVGRTVFEGTRVEEFTVNIVGVLENVMARIVTSFWRGSKADRSPTPASSPG